MTKGYYDIQRVTTGFEFTYTEFDDEKEVSFEDSFFNEWLEAKQNGARMVILETQTCNENAIAFYKKNGFEIIGFDLYAYSNDDPEKHEIRIEMGRKL